MRSFIASTSIVLATVALAAQTSTPKPAAPKPAAPAAAAPKPAAPAPNRLLNPAALTAKAPETFKVKFDTTKGPIVLELHRDWAPKGVDRFYNMTRNGFFNGVRFFRVIPNFMAQFGINGDPAVNEAWEKARLADDPPNGKSNVRGILTYGTAGQPNSRGTQLFINYKDNSYLDKTGFVPIGEVVEGMELVDMLYADYGAAPQNEQNTLVSQGNKYMQTKYPKLDYVKTATIVK
ncbi:MAG TPA: peptidylprolyl isomerase [Vicinamibacterales bacterium]|nr:peptidylprolyl isomerase [Vicinamibacterales bacterium]